jgi:outer membrane protein W
MKRGKFNCTLSDFVIRGSLAILISLSFISLSAQEEYWYNTAGTDCYSEMIFVEKALAPAGVIVVNVGETDLQAYSKNNVLLNSGRFESFSFLYIQIRNLGQSDVIDCIDAIISSVSSGKRINISAFFFINEIKSSEVIFHSPSNNAIKWNSVHYEAGNLNKLSKVLYDESVKYSYRPISRYFDFEADYRKRMENYSKNFDIGVSWSPHFLTGEKLGKKNGFIAPVSLILRKNISQNWAVEISAGGAFKKPDMTAIQSSLQSEVMAAIQNDEDSVFIDQTINAHVMIGGSVSAIKYFNSNKQFRPYVGVGFGVYSMMNIAGSIQDTLDVSDIDMNDPSSMQSAMGEGFDTDSAGDNMENISSRFITPSVEYGFEYRVAPAFKVGASVPLKYFIDRSNTGNSTLSVGLNFKMAITLNSGRYPSIKLKD